MADQPEATGGTQKAERSFGYWFGVAGAVVALLGGLIGVWVWIYPLILVPDVGGGWVIASQTEVTTYSPYKGLKLTYQVFLTQNGTSFTGSGEKMTENGSAVSAKGKTRIDITGILGHSSIEATFVESGIEHPSTGAFHWQRKGKGPWVGTFESNVAGSSGSSTFTPVAAASGH
jgi:hypothetical protein